MIVIYTTNTCAYCAMVERYLDSKHKEYIVINLDEHPEKREDAFALSGALTVPITVIDGSVVVGWNLQKLAPLVKD